MRAWALACRPEHQEPTSDEVGMQRGPGRRRLVPNLLLRASYKTGSQVSSSRSYDEASLADVAASAYNDRRGGANMVKRLLVSLVTAVTFSSAFSEVRAAQTVALNQRRQQRQRMNPGIDDRMVRQAPRIGDEQMARKAPQHIDDGIFRPRRIFRMYDRTAKPKIR